MNILKKLITSIILIIIIISAIFTGAFPTTVNAASTTGSLNDGQRQGLVDGIVKIIDAGNSGANLRYCQVNRLSGFNNLAPVNSGKKQQTSGTVELDSKYYAQLQALIDQKHSSEKQKYMLVQPQKYNCTVLGADITGKIAFDCSSLVDAAYKFAVGTSFTWATGQFEQDSSYFKVIPMSDIKPGDVLWHSGHVGIYLGDINNDGVAETAQAHGFMAVSKSANPAGYMGASDALFSFLSTHLEYVITTPQQQGFKSKPTVQLPDSAIRDAKHQVDVATKFNAKDWEKALTYVGPVKAGTTQDLTGLKTPTDNGKGSSTGGQDSTLQEYEKTGMANAITVPNKNIVVWPKDGLTVADDPLINSDGYFYKGAPTFGEYVGKVTILDWFNSSSSTILNWIIGMVTMGIKIQFIGWTSICENTVGEILNFGTEDMNQSNTSSANTGTSSTGTNTGTSGTSANNSTGTGTSLFNVIKGDHKVTVEDVIFNRVPLLDANFFDFSNAGGKQLSQNSLIYKVRQGIAGWYSTLRTVAIMGMLAMLIYLAIRMALSTVAGEKGNYKSKFVDWLVGFIIVITIHYFMIAIITVNNQFVKMLDFSASSSTTSTTQNTIEGDPDEVTANEQFGTMISGLSTVGGTSNQNASDNEQSIYETVRIQAYDIQATTGWAATLIYMVLVYYLIRFVVFYTGRLFTLAILTIISPLMGVLYAMNKRKYPLKNWGLEYGHNVLIQLVHAIIYSAFISIALQLTKTSTFKGAIIAIIFLGFIFSAEEIVKKIFAFDKSKSLSSLAKSSLTATAVYMGARRFGKKSIGATKAAITGTARGGSYIRNRFKKTPAEAGGIRGLQDYGEASSNSNDNVNAGGLGFGNSNNAGAGDNAPNNNNGDSPSGVVIPPEYDKRGERQYLTASDIEDQIEEKGQEIAAAKREFIWKSTGNLVGGILGTAALMASIPIIIVNPKVGVTGTIGASIISMRRGFKESKHRIKGPRREKKSKLYTGGKLMFGWATGGASFAAESLIKNAEGRVKNYNIPEKQMKQLEKARELEDELIREIAKIVNGEQQTDTTDTKQKFQEFIRKRSQNDLKTALDGTFETVTKQEVSRAVTAYIIKNKLIDVEVKDVEKIAVQINELLKEEDKNLMVTDQFTENLRDVIKEKIKAAGNYATEEDLKKEGQTSDANPDKNATSDDDSRRTTAKPRTKEHNNTTDGDTLREEHERKQHEQTHDDKDKKSENSSVLDEALKTAREKPHTKEKEGQTDVESQEDAENQTDPRTLITESELDEKVEEVVKGMSNKEIIELMTEALQKEGSIYREIPKRYEPIMNIVKELDDVNKNYEEATGEPIYPDIKDLVKYIQEQFNRKGV